MKQITLSILLIAMLSIINHSAFSQANTIKTDTVTIAGNCGQCKERIEEAAYIKGVKKAEWDKTTKILTVVYNTDKTNIAKIAASVAKAGHDSGNHKASEESYKKLPDCCAYRSGVCHHE